MKQQANGEIRIGFYVCHCGHNIAAMVDCPEVAKYVEKLPGVVLSRDYKYMCSDPGQELIQKDIQEFKLNRIVVASCSPLLHEHTFRGATEAGGLNPFFFHMVNIREHDSWVHTDRKEATEKAKALARAAIERVAHHQALEVKKVPDPSGRAGGRRRHRGHPRGHDPGQRRQEGLPGRARALHRRPHGEVRQDLPHAGLRGLHSHAEDVRGRLAPEHHALDLLRGDQGGRLRRQLHRDRQAQAALHQRRPLHRLPGVHRQLRLQGAEVPRRVQRGPRQAQAGLHPLPAGHAAGGADRPGGLPELQARRAHRQVQEDLRRGLRREEGHRLHAEGRDQGDQGRHHHRGHRLQDLRRQAHPAVRLRHLPERLYRAGGRAPGQRLRPDRRRGDPARRPAAEGHRHHPLRRLARQEDQPLVLARLLHVFAEAGAPAQGAHRRRDLQLLHRHAHARARATRSSTTSCSKKACTSSAAAWAKSPTGP